MAKHALVHNGDMDYVALFQELAHVNLTIERDGPEQELVVARAWLELAMGDYAGARDSAGYALTLEGDPCEAQFIRAEAWFEHAMAIQGQAVWNPGHAGPTDIDVASALEAARDGFTAIVATDEDALGRLEKVEALLADLEKSDL